MSFFHEHFTTIERGSLGVFATLGTVLFSAFSDAEVALRVGGLAIGCAVGLFTLVSVSLDIVKKVRGK